MIIHKLQNNFKKLKNNHIFLVHIYELFMFILCWLDV